MRSFRGSMGCFYGLAAVGVALSAACLLLAWWTQRMWPPESGAWGTVRLTSLGFFVAVAVAIPGMLLLAWREHSGLTYRIASDGLTVQVRGIRTHYSWDRLVVVRPRNPRSLLARALVSDGEKTHFIEHFFVPSFSEVLRLVEAGAHRRERSLTP